MLCQLFSLESGVTYVMSVSSLRYLRVGERGLCLGAEKTRSQKNA
jgi:hypothetical protein